MKIYFYSTSKNPKKIPVDIYGTSLIYTSLRKAREFGPYNDSERVGPVGSTRVWILFEYELINGKQLTRFK